VARLGSVRASASSFETTAFSGLLRMRLISIYRRLISI